MNHQPDSALRCFDLQLPLSGLELPAILTIPEGVCGLVVFVHGSGSNRFSARNHAVAQTLQSAGLATLLFDLLTGAEQQGAACHAPDLMQLSQRLLAVIAAVRQLQDFRAVHHLQIAQLPLGLFGSSSGAAVALAAAAQDAAPIRAVVSRGGRPDLVSACLGDVHCPTLLLVGSHDLDVLELNSWAAARLQGVRELRVVPGAGHLFSEPGALEQVSSWSREWFLQHLLA